MQAVFLAGFSHFPDCLRKSGKGDFSSRHAPMLRETHGAIPIEALSCPVALGCRVGCRSNGGGTQVEARRPR